jgi:nucleoside-diphosphate-sugar epimerase
MNKTMFVLGGTGFIGHEVVIQAVQRGWQVKALVRSEEGANKLRQVGAHPVVGDIYRPETWIAEARGSTALIDLTQPKFPKRLSRSAMKALSAERQAMARTTLEALRRLPAEERPIIFFVSGADDLQPDAQGTISERSPLRSHPRGFAHIGIPVRQLVEASGIEATYAYFGNLVYGPGKVFADQYITGLRNGSAHVLGKGTNRLPLVHVTDAAHVLVHLAGLPRTGLVGRTFIAMDGADTTQRELLDETADLMGVKRPGAIPAWLAAFVAGSIAVETLTLDAHADPSALLATGFHFRYPSHRQGVPATLAALGYTPSTNG